MRKSIGSTATHRYQCERVLDHTDEKLYTLTYRFLDSEKPIWVLCQNPLDFQLSPAEVLQSNPMIPCEPSADQFQNVWADLASAVIGKP